jgi:diguanylate cyclase (GGDEF)-like protein
MRVREVATGSAARSIGPSSSRSLPVPVTQLSLRQAVNGLVETAVVVNELDRLIAGRAHDLELLRHIDESIKAGASRGEIHRQLLLLARSSREAFQSLQTSRETLVSVHKQSAGDKVAAVVDPISGFPNRDAFEARLEETVRNCTAAFDAVLMLIDIGALQFVASELGNKIAGRIVKRFATILKQSVKRTDFIARVGPTQFAIIFRNVLPDNVASIALRIHDAMERKLHPGKDPVMQMLQVTIGIAGNKPDDASSADLLQRAQEAVVTARKQVSASIYLA